MTLKTVVTVAVVTILRITSVSCSDPGFGTGVGSINPLSGSVAILPANPPTTAMNPSQPGMGIAILFPNGASLGTKDDAGALNETTEGRILSNSVGIQDDAWVAVRTSTGVFSAVS